MSLLAATQDPPARPARRRGLLFLAFAILLLGAMAALGESPIGPGAVSGAFSQGPGSLPAGTAGGSQLEVASGGSQATLELWAPVGLPTYFLDVVQFDVHATRATSVRVAADVASLLPSLPVGAEIVAYLGTPAPSGSPGGFLSSPSSSAGAPLAGIAGLGGDEGGFPGLATGVQVNATGIAPLGTTSAATVDFSGAGDYWLVLSVGVVLPLTGGAGMSGPALEITIQLSHPI
jgi:hypothetical protein